MALTNEENLLVTLAEEAAEVVTAVNKMLRFGGDNRHPSPTEDEDFPNRYNVMREFIHVSAMIDMLQKEGVLPTLSEDDKERITLLKHSAVRKYQQVSIKEGTLVNDK